MRKFLVSVALLSAAAVAAPASAQYYPQNYGNQYGYDRYDRYDRAGNNIIRQVRNLEERIQRAAQGGRIDRREAWRLDREADQIERLFYRYRRGGFTQGEHRDLQLRIRNLRAQFRWERRDERRDDRWDRDDRYDRDDRWDRDDDRWDDDDD